MKNNNDDDHNADRFKPRGIRGNDACNNHDDRDRRNKRKDTHDLARHFFEKIIAHQTECDRKEHDFYNRQKHRDGIDIDTLPGVQER